MRAPAKLTLSLRVTGVRPDGMHLLDAEMVTIDLADTLTFEPGTGISVVDEVVGGLGVDHVPVNSDNLVARAMALAGRSATVRVVKRIPAGAGLGGGSADAAAVLRWSGVTDPEVAARLGSDVPFCLVGGRARVSGTGEVVEPLPFEDRRFVLVVPPVAVDTGAVYRAWDRRRAAARSDAIEPAPHGNDLEAAALDTAPVLADWRDRLEELSGLRPRLAGSGSTWFVEGEPESVGLAGCDVVVDDQRAPVVAVRTVAPVGTG
jgi:4-diphosphocytidyl-2-C-methyl-D-erythritol kinase